MLIEDLHTSCLTFFLQFHSFRTLSQHVEAELLSEVRRAIPQTRCCCSGESSCSPEPAQQVSAPNLHLDPDSARTSELEHVNFNLCTRTFLL